MLLGSTTYSHQPAFVLCVWPWCEAVMFSLEMATFWSDSTETEQNTRSMLCAMTTHQAGSRSWVLASGHACLGKTEVMVALRP